MKCTILAALLPLLAFANGLAIEEPGMTPAIRREILMGRQNNGRVVASGACCIAGQSKKQDVCNVNGAAGKCVPANTANCAFLPMLECLMSSSSNTFFLSQAARL